MNKEQKIESRKKLIYYALKYKGDWKSIYESFNKGEFIDEEYLDKELANSKWKVVTIVDEDYPLRFRNITRPPFVLFYYGDLSIADSRKTLGIVGSRDNTVYGERVVSQFINEFSEDIVIVSGLARAIDTLAHYHAINNNLKTIAVLGVGIDYCYPKENYKIYEKIKKEGLILSEYPYKERVSINNFPSRNRLISGLSDAILVPECREKSGTLITVRFALDQGKDVLVVPCSILENFYNNRLIIDGATPVISSKDIEEHIN